MAVDPVGRPEGAPIPSPLARARFAAQALAEERARLLALLAAAEHFAADDLDDAPAALIRCAVETVEKVGPVAELLAALDEMRVEQLREEGSR